MGKSSMVSNSRATDLEQAYDSDFSKEEHEQDRKELS